MSTVAIPRRALIGLLSFARVILIARTVSRKHFKNVSTFIGEPDSRAQVSALEDNVKEFGLTYFGMNDKRQGESLRNLSLPRVNSSRGIYSDLQVSFTLSDLSRASPFQVQLSSAVTRTPPVSVVSR